VLRSKSGAPLIIKANPAGMTWFAAISPFAVWQIPSSEQWKVSISDFEFPFSGITNASYLSESFANVLGLLILSPIRIGGTFTL